MKVLPILIFVSLSFLMLGCTAKRPYLYTVIDAYMYDDLNAQGYYRKYVLIEDSYSDELKAAFDMTTTGSYTKSYAKKSALEISNKSEKDLFLGFVSMEKRKFEEAQVYFRSAAESGIYQANILWLDCQLELGADLDYQSEYQRLYDRAPDPLLREIIRSRYQYYRYGL